MSERPNFTTDYDNEADVNSERFQDGVNVVCDFLDDVLDLPETRSLKFCAHKDNAQLEIDRRFIIDDALVTTSTEIHYEKSKLGDMETYVVTISKFGRFADSLPTSGMASIYTLCRAGERALGGSVYTDCKINTHDSGFMPIRPTERPLMVDDMRAICDACVDIMQEAND